MELIYFIFWLIAISFHYLNTVLVLDIKNKADNTENHVMAETVTHYIIKFIDIILIRNDFVNHNLSEQKIIFESDKKYVLMAHPIVNI